MRLALLLLALLLPTPALAAPEVTASIAPVHSLTARVMQGVGTPHLLLPPEASPHDYALRPSGAAALARADVVIRVGPALEPWLDHALQTLAPQARILQLDRTPGLTRLEIREDAAFEVHDHGEADHGDTHHDEEDTDPHLWLDPVNAGLWLGQIAETLAHADPENAEAYRANATQAAAELQALSDRIEQLLAPVRNRPFILFHDAYHYFEARFRIEAAGAVAVSSARMPGPARIAEIRALMRISGATCIFAEPQLNSRLLATVAEGSSVRTATLDPLGVGLEPGPQLYPKLLEGIASALVTCLAD